MSNGLTISSNDWRKNKANNNKRRMGSNKTSSDNDFGALSDSHSVIKVEKEQKKT